MAFGRTANKELREMADEFIDIEEYPEELLFRSKRSVGKGRGNQKNK